jgi:hypothetical protein
MRRSPSRAIAAALLGLAFGSAVLGAPAARAHAESSVTAARDAEAGFRPPRPPRPWFPRPPRPPHPHPPHP